MGCGVRENIGALDTKLSRVNQACGVATRKEEKHKVARTDAYDEEGL